MNVNSCPAPAHLRQDTWLLYRCVSVYPECCCTAVSVPVLLYFCLPPCTLSLPAVPLCPALVTCRPVPGAQVSPPPRLLPVSPRPPAPLHHPLLARPCLAATLHLPPLPSLPCHSVLLPPTLVCAFPCPPTPRAPLTPCSPSCRRGVIGHNAREKRPSKTRAIFLTLIK